VQNNKSEPFWNPRFAKLGIEAAIIAFASGASFEEVQASLVAAVKAECSAKVAKLDEECEKHKAKIAELTEECEEHKAKIAELMEESNC